MSKVWTRKEAIVLGLVGDIRQSDKGPTKVLLSRRIKSDFPLIFFDNKKRETFWNQNLSDGTLRAMAILFILGQASLSNDQKPSLIGIEEPELTLHPAATSVLLDAMREASQNTQILVTTHSPDLLDNVDLENGNELVLAVDARDGETIIAPIDSASREIVKENLFSLGDLLRMRQLEPEIIQPKEQV